MGSYKISASQVWVWQHEKESKEVLPLPGSAWTREHSGASDGLPWLGLKWFQKMFKMYGWEVRAGWLKMDVVGEAIWLVGLTEAQLGCCGVGRKASRIFSW